MRALIESSTVLAFGMAASLTWLGHHRVWSYVLAILLPWFLALNQLQMHQYGRGIIHWDSMTSKAYWAVFGHVHPAPPSVMERRDRHLSEPDYAKAKEDRTYRKGL